MEVSTVAVSQIRLDGGTQSRASINDEVINDYAESIASGVTFPPIIVFFDGSDYWLADGFHRHGAHVKAGAQTIEADVHQGDQRAARLFSAGANSGHGLRRTNDDKRRSVVMLLEDEEWSTWSDGRIADQCGVTREFVNRMRAKTCDPITSKERTFVHAKTGQPTIMNTAAIGKGSQLDEKKAEQVRNDTLRQETIDGLRPEVKAQQDAKQAAIDAAKTNTAEPDGMSDAERIAELEEQNRILVRDYEEVVAENRQYEAMKALFKRGGYEAVIAAKDEVIRVAETRIYGESQDKVSWMNSAKFWKKQALALGYKPTGKETEPEVSAS